MALLKLKSHIFYDNVDDVKVRILKQKYHTRNKQVLCSLADCTGNSS